MHGSGSGRNSTVVASSVAIVRAVHGSGSGRSSTVVASFITAVRAVHGSDRSSNRALSIICSSIIETISMTCSRHDSPSWIGLTHIASLYPPSDDCICYHTDTKPSSTPIAPTNTHTAKPTGKGKLEHQFSIF